VPSKAFNGKRTAVVRGFARNDPIFTTKSQLKRTRPKNREPDNENGDNAQEDFAARGCIHNSLRVTNRFLWERFSIATVNGCDRDLKLLPQQIYAYAHDGFCRAL
jgi:hypothetical protein